MATPETDHFPTASEDSGPKLFALVENIGKLVGAFLGFAYLCGLLVLYSFFSRMGIHLNTELLRIRYVEAGVLSLAFPLLLVPIFAQSWTILQQHRDRLASAKEDWSSSQDGPGLGKYRNQQ